MRQTGSAASLIIGGDSCAYNPEPLADFFDLFYIGEGETVFQAVSVMRLRIKFSKQGRTNIKIFARRLSFYPGKEPEDVEGYFEGHGGL